MKLHLLVVYMALTCNFAHAAQCLSTSESKALDNIYQNSSEFYRHVKLDCQSTDEIVQKNCAILPRKAFFKPVRP